jgi:pimeloyl-ACP methyl ester carboxylesterase
MTRMHTAVLAGLGLIVTATPRPASAQGDAFGRMFEKAARDVARKAVVGPGGVAQQLGAPGAARSEPYTTKTKDGWTVVAHRFRPTAAPRPGALPIILCHGLSYNASFWDLDPSCSFVEFLTSQGYDVWVADLRGSGSSTKWVAKLDEAPELVLGSAVRRLSRGKLAPTGYATVDPKFGNWTLDHHIAFDVPAFVELVRRVTGAAEVTWIGHSMGGIVAIAHLARSGNPGIGRLVTVGSQVTMPNGQIAVQFLREMIETRTRQLSGQLSAERLMAETRTSVHNLFFNQRNVLPAVYEALGTTATDVPSLGVMKQYMTLATEGELLDARKQFNYARALSNVRVPILVACGADDQFAPPAVQRYLYDNVGSTDKTLIVFGRSMGFAVDAGHDDALVGLNSRAQVYPVIESWLRGARPKAR